jgi:adenosylcobinamide kinase/adenosylcobinamide-phosphate guanylyltransferase
MGEMILVLGGRRSGKSSLAERLAGATPPVCYVATCLSTPDDAEMAARIACHRQNRPEGWETREVPYDLEGLLPSLCALPGAVLIDCVTLWLTNLIFGLGGPALGDDDAVGVVERTAKAARGTATVVWVSNEVGSGIVPETPLARRFADLQGLANQRLAEASDAVYLSVAGLTLRLK